MRATMVAGGLLGAFVLFWSAGATAATRPGNDKRAGSISPSRATAGHDSSAGSAFTPDGKILLTANLDGTVRLWETESGRLLRTLAHPDSVTSAVFSPDGKLVLSVGGDKQARIWSTADGRLLRTLPHPGTITAAVFGPDGKLVLTGDSAQTVRIWDTASGRLLRSLRSPVKVTWSATSASFSRDGKLVLTAGEDKTARVWLAASGRLLRTLRHSDAVDTAVFSPNGKLIATTDGKVARVWETATGRVVSTIPQPKLVENAVFSRDGTRLLTAGGFDQTVRIWNATSGRLLRTLKTQHSYVERLVLSPGGTRLATSSWLDEKVQIWDTATGRLLRTLSHPSELPSVGFSPNGARILTTSKDGMARLWDVTSGSLVRTLDTALVAPCAVAPGAATERASLSFVRGHDVVLADADGGSGSTALQGVSTGPEESRVWYYDPAWSADGACLAVSVGGYPTGSHWYADVAVFRGSQEIDLPGGMSSISGSPSWEPGGRRVVLVGYQFSVGGGLYIQGVGSGTDMSLTPENSDPESATPDDMPAWSPDGSMIAFARISARRSQVYVIRPDRTGLRQVTTTGGANPSWSPDGRQLAFDDGRRIAVVNVDGSGLRYLTRPPGIELDVDPAWSPDGRSIAFTRYTSDEAEIGDVWLVAPTGGEPRLFVKDGSQPAWKPQ